MSRTADIERKLSVEAHSSASQARGVVRVFMKSYKNQANTIQSSKDKLREYKRGAGAIEHIVEHWELAIEKAEKAERMIALAATKWFTSLSDSDGSAWGDAVYAMGIANNDVIMAELLAERG